LGSRLCFQPARAPSGNKPRLLIGSFRIDPVFMVLDLEIFK
jgi:hypothetical protein